VKTLTRILLLAAIAAALGVRLWGIDFGLPVTSSRPDEAILLREALRFFGGDYRPSLFNYPSLCMYVLHALFRVDAWLSVMLGRHASQAAFLGAARIDPSALILIARSLSAVLGAATVLVLHRWARSLYGERTALVAAWFLALAYLHVRESHFGVTDVPATFLLVCTLWCIERIRLRPTWPRYLAAGLCAGLASSTKYAGLFLAIPLLAEHLANPVDARGLWRRLSDPKLVLFGLAMLGAFAAGTPYALLELRHFWQDFSYESHHLMQGHAGIRNVGWLHHLSFTLLFGLGWSLLLAAVAGLVLALRADWRRALAWVAFPVLYFLIVGRGATTFARYLLPIVPSLCLAAAFTVTLVSRRSALGTLALAALVLWPSAARVIALDTRLARADTRLLAWQWLAQHATGGSTISQSSPMWGRVIFPPPLARLSAEVARGRSYNAEANAILAAQLEARRALGFPDLVDRPIEDGRLPEPPPDYVIVIESPLQPEPVPPQVAARVQQDYVLAASFPGGDADIPAARYDRQDAFYLPFSDFAGVERPGPNLAIYRAVAR
jgi:hypothetical protein